MSPFSTLFIIILLAMETSAELLQFIQLVDQARTLLQRAWQLLPVELRPVIELSDMHREAAPSPEVDLPETEGVLSFPVGSGGFSPEPFEPSEPEPFEPSEPVEEDHADENEDSDQQEFDEFFRNMVPPPCSLIPSTKFDRTESKDPVPWTDSEISRLKEIKADTKARPSWTNVARSMGRDLSDVKKMWLKVKPPKAISK